MTSRRVATAAVGIPLFLGAVYLGNHVLVFSVALLSLASTEELLSILKFRGSYAKWLVRFWAIMAAVFAGYFSEYREDALVVLGLLYLSIKTLVHMKNREMGALDEAVRQVLITFLALFYPSFLLSYLLMMRSELGYPVTWMVLIAVWANDTAAYFYGKARGRTPLAPGISPGKTVQGAIAGLVAGVAFTALAGLELTGWPLWVLAALGLLIAVMSQTGDLFESLLKRIGGIKDSGRALPGHGGFLDRSDSLAFVIPVAYYFLVYFQESGLALLPERLMP